jgi:hypothetical protein
VPGSAGQPEWWQFSRCENSARVIAGGTNIEERAKPTKPLRRWTRRYCSQREQFYHLPAGSVTPELQPDVAAGAARGKFPT